MDYDPLFPSGLLSTHLPTLSISLGYSRGKACSPIPSTLLLKPLLFFNGSFFLLLFLHSSVHRMGCSGLEDK